MNGTSWHLNANEVNAVERDEEDLTYLWLAERAKGRIRYLTIARSHNSPRVYIERDEQSWSCYDGIEKVTMDNNSLKVHLNGTGTSFLGNVECLSVTFRPEVKPACKDISKVLTILSADGAFDLRSLVK